MSDEKSGSSSNPAQGLGIFAAIFCAFAGFDQGGWGGAAIAAVLAYGAVQLLFAAIGLALRLIIGGAILFVMLAVLSERAQWLAELFE